MTRCFEAITRAVPLRGIGLAAVWMAAAALRPEPIGGVAAAGATTGNIYYNGGNVGVGLRLPRLPSR